MANTSNNSVATIAASEANANVNQHPAKSSAARKGNKNALIHGVYAEELVLAWEDPNELVTLSKEVWAEFQPEGALEEETALGLVRLMWLKRRSMRTTQLGFHRDPFTTGVARSGAKTWDDVANLVTSASDDRTSLSKTAKESLESLKEAIEKVRAISTACLPGHSEAGPPEEAFEAAHSAERGVKFVEKILTEQVFPRMIALEGAQKSDAATIYEKAYSHEHLEKVLQLEAKLDARIDKQLARLVSLKEYKRIRNETYKQVEAVRGRDKETAM